MPWKLRDSGLICDNWLDHVPILYDCKFAPSLLESFFKTSRYGEATSCTCNGVSYWNRRSKVAVASHKSSFSPIFKHKLKPVCAVLRILGVLHFASVLCYMAAAINAFVNGADASVCATCCKHVELTQMPLPVARLSRFWKTFCIMQTVCSLREAQLESGRKSLPDKMFGHIPLLLADMLLIPAAFTIPFHEVHAC